MDPVFAVSHEVMARSGRRGRRPLTPEQARRREETLRPNRFLGYDHDSVGTHLLSIGALEPAESELRRAVWLNPYERRFRVHLGWCLLRAGKLDEAHEIASTAAQAAPGDEDCLRLLMVVREKLGARRTDEVLPADIGGAPDPGTGPGDGIDPGTSDGTAGPS